MIRDIVTKHHDRRLAAFSVYIPMVPGDSSKPAAEASKKLEGTGIEPFWDGDRSLGKAYARTVRLPAGRPVAWDVYFVYGPDAKWGKTTPKPSFWMHQLANDEKCLDPAKFRSAVEKELAKMNPSTKLTLLTREGCGGTATMRKNLDAAIKSLRGWSYEVLDLGKLPKGDPRRGYPTPTLLLNGHDIFGMPEPDGKADSPG